MAHDPGERQGWARLKPFQADPTVLFRLAIQLIFNLLIVIVLVALFTGVGRVFLNLTFRLSQATVPTAFNVIVPGVLSLLVVIERFRSFVEDFDHRRVRARTGHWAEGGGTRDDGTDQFLAASPSPACQKPV